MLKNLLTTGIDDFKMDNSDGIIINKIYELMKDVFDNKNKYVGNKNLLFNGQKIKIKNGLTIRETVESFYYRPNYVASEIEIFDLYNYLMMKYADKILTELNVKIDTGKKMHTLALLHYDNLKSDISKHIYGKYEHTDCGFLTILHTNQNGLQIKKNNEWINYNSSCDNFVVIIGDTLQEISNNLYKAVTHRVLIEKEKYSIAFFFELENKKGAFCEKQLKNII